MLKKYKKKQKEEKGISLVEIIVSVGLFGLLVVLVAGAFANIISIQAQVESKQRLMNEFTMSLDLLGKEIMAGESFPQAPDGVNFISFQTRVRTDMEKRIIQYRLEDGVIKKAQQDTQGGCQLAEVQDGDGNVYGLFPDECFEPFTSEDIYVDDLTFYVQNFEDDGFGRPVVIVSVSGEIKLSDSTSSFQTSSTYAPRKSLSPDDRLPLDTTPPIIEIESINDFDLPESFIEPLEVDSDEIKIAGWAIDPGGSGIKMIRVQNLNNGHSQHYNYESGVNDVDWEFEGVKLLTGLVTNTIRMTVQDNSNHTVFKSITIRSTVSPENPNPPTLSIDYECMTNSSEINYIRIRMTEDDSGGPFNRYRIERSNDINSNIEIFDIPKHESSINTDFYDTENIEKGVTYTYRVFAVNTDWEWYIESDEALTSISIELDTCVPSVSNFVASLRCRPATGNIYAWGYVVGTSNAVFKLLDGNNSDEVLRSGGGGLDTWYWQYHSDISQSLSVGDYLLKAVACYGEDCSLPLERNLTVNEKTCKPPDSFVRAYEDPNLRIRCGEYPVGHPQEGNPSIYVGIGVGREIIDPPDPTRAFHGYFVYECSDENCTDEVEIGHCVTNMLAFDNCVIYHYDRVDGTYYYRVRTYNGITEQYGDYSDVFTQSINASICDLNEPEEYNLVIEAELICNGQEEHDYREITVSINDNNDDIATVYKVYSCPDGVCEATPLGQCDWNSRGACLTHYGPEDLTVHSYAVEICHSFDESSCTDIYRPMNLENSVSISENQCFPQTAEIESFDIIPSSQCVSPEATYQMLEVRAFSTEPSNNHIYINVYKDGGPFASSLDQGQLFTDIEVIAGESYTYGFEACNLLADPSCGEIVEDVYTVEENICNPTPPSGITFSYPVCDLGNIVGLTIDVNRDAQYHHGYEIERHNPSSPNFSCSFESGGYDPVQCTDNFEPPLSSPVTYGYRANSYRDDLRSSFRYRNIYLDPSIHCEAPFELRSNSNFMLVVISGGGVGTVTSETVIINIDPVEGFEETVYFSEENINFEPKAPMAGMNLEDINIFLVNKEVEHPYSGSSRFRFFVSIPDWDYLGSKNYDVGAVFTIIGETASGVQAEVSVPLLIEWQEGMVD